MITSTQNEQFKKWMKLKTKKYRDLYDAFLVYGHHLVDLAKAHDVIINVITTNPNIDGILIDDKLMKQLMQTETTYDVMAMCKKTNIKKTSNRILMLDDVQDPDNVGALMRSALAFGFNHIILGRHCADLYNEKVIRASKGAIFDLYVERAHLIDQIPALKDLGYAIMIADAKGKQTIQKHDKIALIMGNEGQGVKDEIKALSTHMISIPTEHVESLNVSVAGGILMYLWRQP